MVALGILLALSGSAIGYSIGTYYNLSGLELFWEIVCGAFFGHSLIIAVEQKDYDSWLGALLSMMIALALDWLAGSGVDLRNKLSFMFMGSFTGWLFRAFWKQVLIGGLIGGGIGFVWGLLDSHWFGQVCLAPGFLNASLLAAQISMIGMGLGSLYMKLFGWRFLANRRQIHG